MPARPRFLIYLNAMSDMFGNNLFIPWLTELARCVSGFISSARTTPVTLLGFQGLTLPYLEPVYVYALLSAVHGPDQLEFLSQMYPIRW